MKESLQGRYIKEYLQTFLLLPFGDDPGDVYQIRMLTENGSKCFLNLTPVLEGGEAYCKYLVGGMKPMELVFRTLPIDLARLTALLKSFVSVFDEAAELLLDPDDIVLMPEYVFMNITDYNAGFVYLPGYGKSISKQAEAFFEYMLNRVDYDDKRAVALLYDCYIMIMKEERGIEALKDRIEKETPEPVEQSTEILPPVKKPEQTVSAELSFRSWFGGRFGKKKEKKMPIAFHEEDIFNFNETQDTVLLSDRKQELFPSLVSLKNDDKTTIEKWPFIIGSLTGHTDFMPGENVSRLHAEIRKTAKGAALVDLNSTNGTKLNGANLIPGEEYLLYNNDKISFANLDYIYKEGMPTM